MKRKTLGIAVVLAALAVLINVFALRTATVDNGFTLTVADTTTALIAVTGPGVGGDGDVSFTVNNGSASIALPTAGFQPKSSYEFGPSFKVKNNSSATRTISLGVTGLPAGVTVTFTDGTGAPFDGTNVLANGERTVGLKFVLDSSFVTSDLKAYTGTLTVTAN